MYAMFMKEMQQFCRGINSKIMAVLIVVVWFSMIGAYKFEVPELEKFKNLDPAIAITYYRHFGYPVVIGCVAVLGVIWILGNSAARWRMELGDPAFSPGITTCTPAWQLALGKWSALMVQTMGFALLAGILPLTLFCRMKSTQTLVAVVKEFSNFTDDFIVRTLTEIGDLFSRMPLLAFCMLITLSSMSLAVCSLKPRSRGKFDFGTVAVVMLIVIQSVGLTIGTNSEFFVQETIIRTVMLTVGSLALISSGVSAPGANRLLFFKIWVFLSVVVIIPLVHRLTGSFSTAGWSVELVAAALFFIVCSLFERLIQSRRVLAQMSDPLLAIIAFPFSTGALNSFALSGILCIAANIVFSMEMDWFLLIATAAALSNLIGFFMEKMGRRFIRFAAFVIMLAFYAVTYGWVNNEMPGFFDENSTAIRAVEVILTGGALFILAINYNYRKKDL